MHTNIYFVLIVFCINYCVCKKYYNYTLYRGIPADATHMEFLNNLTELYDVDFWRPPGLMFKPVEFVVSPENRRAFLSDANRIGINLTPVIEDVQKAFDMQTVKPYIRRKMDSFDWNNYFRLDDIYQWLRDLGKAYPESIQLITIGRTDENRDILAVRFSQYGFKKRSIVIVEGGIHAREWISPAFVTYMLNEFVHAPSSKSRQLTNLQFIARRYVYYFVPVLNPDGYEFSHTQDRLWRKNRKRNYYAAFYGVDLNRNFDYAFGTYASKKPSSNEYCGPKPFSEKESQAMGNFIRTHNDDLEYYLAFHSYGQYMIIPYANSSKRIDNFDEVHRSCKEAIKKIESKYNTKYTVGTTLATVGYFASGLSTCWVKSTFGVPNVVTFELRDDGTDGFALPPQKILPTCKETIMGVLSFLNPRGRLNYSHRYKGKPFESFLVSGQTHSILDKILIVFNVFLFIIICFE